jgi:hypothetical protein
MASRKKPPTAAEKRYMALVASCGCLVCGEPASVHHCRDGIGLSARAGNYLTVPLCYEHHQGASGWHALQAARFFDRYRMREKDMLDTTIGLVIGKLLP